MATGHSYEEMKFNAAFFKSDKHRQFKCVSNTSLVICLSLVTSDGVWDIRWWILKQDLIFCRADYATHGMTRSRKWISDWNFYSTTGPSGTTILESDNLTREPTLGQGSVWCGSMKSCVGALSQFLSVSVRNTKKENEKAFR